MSIPVEHSAEGMKVFEFKGSNILRHPRVFMKFLPFLVCLAAGAFYLAVTTFSPLWPMFLIIVSLAILAFLTFSNVKVAVMDGLIIVEEKARYYFEQHEFDADQIDRLEVETRHSNDSVTHYLKICLREGEDYTLPSGKKSELETIANEIRQTLHPDVNGEIETLPQTV